MALVPMRSLFLILTVLNIFIISSAVFSSGWRSFKSRKSHQYGQTGLVSWVCQFPPDCQDRCHEWNAQRPSWETACLGLFYTAIGLNVVLALLTSLSTFCDNSKNMSKFLMIFPNLACILVATGLGLFLANEGKDAEVITDDLEVYGMTMGYGVFVMFSSLIVGGGVIFAQSSDYFLTFSLRKIF